MSDLIFVKEQMIKKNCLCCGREMNIPDTIEQDFCDRCYPVVCRETFNPENGNLTIKELREKIKNELH